MTNGWEIVNRFPHDPTAFTQELVFHDGRLYEGTGQEGESSLREVELESGKVLRKTDLSPELWANVWMTNQIVIIDPLSGRVTGVVDLTGILTPRDREGRDVDVLNGIAHDPATGRIFVTGKYWPRSYEIRLRSQ